MPEPFNWNQTCSGIAGKSQEIWKESELGEWFVVITAGAAIAAGILGSVASLVPAASAIGGFGSGLATIAGGVLTHMNERQSAELEPKFNDFTEITSYIANSSQSMQNSIEQYSRWLLNEIPSNDRSNGVFYVDDPQSLPNVLLNGDFAEPRTVKRLPDEIYISLFSAAISILWKGEAANVVRVPHNTLVTSVPPCEDENFFSENKWCDSEGNAYLLLGWDRGKYKVPWQEGLADSLKDLKGLDKLGAYRLDIETVAKASEHAATLNNGNAYYEWNTERTIEHMRGGEHTLAKFSGFNLPFCDMGDYYPLEEDECDNEITTRFRLMALAEPKSQRKGSFSDFMDRMLHRDHHENKEHPNEDKETHEPHHEDEPHKENDMDRLKDTARKGEEMQNDVRAYDNLL
ncbi:hypothetical protein N7457_006186 [Penicillium paradoxum]|uniref:uncharacterized protein n=1 Tax=Penicillium paradoxum TaxID=176176 RepID=UPI002547AE44|nr:uncharacterized protein N7457_006186 [Penicillium paradoxum]KAJ5781026.1 hypothetical protein N7457_006186 [Penicillium paradoxum]